MQPIEERLHSHFKCTTCFVDLLNESLLWRSVAEAFSGCRIKKKLDRLNVFACVVGYVGFTGHVSAQDAIGVFNHAALPETVGIAAPDIASSLIVMV